MAGIAGSLSLGLGLREAAARGLGITVGICWPFYFRWCKMDFSAKLLVIRC